MYDIVALYYSSCGNSYPQLYFHKQSFFFRYELERPQSHMSLTPRNKSNIQKIDVNKIADPNINFGTIGRKPIRVLKRL